MLLNDRDQIIAMTAEWTGERYPNGRPRVSDEKIEILKTLTQEEIWQPLYSCGYRFQFQGDLKPLHPNKKLYGRAVTCCFMPQRPDLRQHVFNVARSRGWKGDCNQWVIDSLEENDVVVCDLYDKILRGTFVGGNLTTAVKARTKNGGVVVWGGVRDLEQMQNIDVQVFYRGVDPTPIRDCQITAFNGPCRIGAAICLPGDIVIGTKNGILFVPSHMVDYVIEHAYKSQVRDLYAFPKLEAGIYTTADVDAVVWNDQMMQALLNFIDGGHNGGHHPEFMEELGRGIVANISILVGHVGNDNSQHRKQDGIEHAIERSEHGALFGIVGHAALGALGNNALAGVAQVINAAEHNKENKAGGAFRQFVGKVEHDKAGSRQNDVANDHKRAVFAELAVGFIHHVANERVSYAVPDTHSHGKAGCHDHANANKAQQIKTDIVHEHQVEVGCGVVERKACNAPQRYAVDAVCFVILVIILVGQGSCLSHFFSPYLGCI